MNKKVKNTKFENIYYYMNRYILIDEKTKIYYILNLQALGAYYENKENALDTAIEIIDKREKENNELYKNIEYKLCNLVKKDLARMIYNNVQHEKKNNNGRI